MEKYLKSGQFRAFTGYNSTVGKYNSIRDRLCSINADYFEGLFNRLFEIYSSHLNESTAITRLDSTYVSLASKLLRKGMVNGSSDKKFVKFSISLKGSLPSSVKVFLDQPYVSEDLALGAVAKADEKLSGNIVVFDRGLQSREVFESITSCSKFFVCRANPRTRVVKGEAMVIEPKPAEATVTILSDSLGYLTNKKGKMSSHRYRVIKGTMDKNGQAICFVSNIEDQPAYDLAKIYTQRWDIEVFFKFLKQHLNMKHLVCRTPNGIKVMIYMTLILAMLLMVYKKLNKIKGYKIAKLQFELELETEVIKTIVELCGGNPDRAPHIFNSS